LAALMPRWSVDIIRKRAEHLGEVEAKDEADAIARAGKLFDIPVERQNRIRAQAGQQQNGAQGRRQTRRLNG
jgi:hypothetical protein